MSNPDDAPKSGCSLIVGIILLIIGIVSLVAAARL